MNNPKQTEQSLNLKPELQWRQQQNPLIRITNKDWQRTIDALPDLVFIVDPHHTIVYMNKAMRENLSPTFEQKFGGRCHACFHGRETVIENCPHEQLMADGRQRTVELYEDSLQAYFELTVAPYYNADSILAGSVHIARDISEHVRARRDQEKLQAKLLHAAKLESVGQLAAGIAHEINTPAQFISANISFIGEALDKSSTVLTAVQQLIADLKDGAISQEKIADIETIWEDLDWDYLKQELPLAVAQTKEGIHRVTSIVQAIKEFSHPGSKQKTYADLNKIIETTITLARNEWKYVATVLTDFDPALQPLPCHADEMGQVILNILINSGHAIETVLGKNPEGEKGRITVATIQHEHHVEIRVSDTGAGIPEAVQHKVFDPFFTTKEVGKGTGQGLAIAHDVITTKHDGTIVFETGPNQGTTFIIRLPRATSF